VATRWITSRCRDACVDVCPCDCIVGPVPLDELRKTPVADRARVFPDVQMFIDPDECIDCDACLQECPVAAIYYEGDVPAEHAADIERNAEFFRRRITTST
jgi:NAD-dependent dihydropyrimidine dehydrogenase PreA subunit